MSQHRPKVKVGFTLNQAAQILGASVPALRKWIKKGKLPGARRTAGGHRFLPRETLLDFMRQRGLSSERLKLVERRRHARVAPGQGRIFLEASLPGKSEPLGQGLGILKDVSKRGFQVGGLRWQGDYVPAPGASFFFRVERGGLRGVAGTGRVAWLSGVRGAGLSLGAEVRRIGVKKTVWAAYTTEVN